MNVPHITSILKGTTEARDVKTFTFNHPGDIIPGQFFMIWVPGVDEIPMGISYFNEDVKAITFRKVGDATTALYRLKDGDRFGVRGPYGKGFNIEGKHILFVGGGTGIAMIAPAVEQALKKKISSTVILGVKTKNDLFFEDRLRKCGANVYVSTDDGSAGYKGLASDLAKELMEKHQFTSVLTCGPEIMMKKLLNQCKNVQFQASLERYMKCGIGLCGQCCIDKGLRVCVEGPVFDGKTLQQVEDFGIYHRDAAGRRVRY